MRKLELQRGGREFGRRVVFAQRARGAIVQLQALGGQRVDALLQLGVQRGGHGGIGAQLCVCVGVFGSARVGSKMVRDESTNKESGCT